MAKNSDAAVSKALGEPVFIYFSDEVHRSRRNLIILTFSALAYKLSGATIESFDPFGINFKNFEPEFIDKAFFIFLLYSFVHFFWQCIDAFQEWRIRITGTRLSHVTGAKFVSEYGDYPDDPRQSSLMTWWKIEASKIGKFSDLVEELENSMQSLEVAAKSKDLGEIPNLSQITDITKRMEKQLTALGRKIEASENVICSQRIPESLHRFERWYKHFSWSQHARWLLLEWGMPVGLSLWALFLVFPKSWWQLSVG